MSAPLKTGSSSFLLQPAPSEPGAWVNPAWVPGTPGTFAVIIGVSRYDHLDGSAESFGLDQLEVSALTANSVFEWLGSEYYIDGCPIARCWKLLAPTPDELLHTPELGDHALSPTFANCKWVIESWWGTMQDLPPSAAEASRGFFFFSGHGLEVHRYEQVMLPADYLKPPARNWNDAISRDNLERGLRSLRVPLQLFFIDACREFPAKLRGDTRITTVLPERDIVVGSRPYASPVLHATSSGTAALQPVSPSSGLSLFGRSLLDGFAGKPDLAVEKSPTTLQVRLLPLSEFTERRVIQQLVEAGERRPQLVTLSGQVRNVVVTEIPDRLGFDEGQFDVLADGTGALARGAALLDELSNGPLPLEANSVRLEDSTESFITPRSEWIIDNAGARLFGSDSASEMWTNGLRLFAIGTGTVVTDPDAVEIRRVRREANLRQWEIDLAIRHDDDAGHWIELTDGTGTPWVVLLPRLSGNEAPTFRIDFALGEGEGRPLVRLDGSISALTVGPSQILSDVWRAWRFGGSTDALAAVEVLVERVEGLRSLPMAAITAGFLALQKSRLDLAMRLIAIVNESIDRNADAQFAAVIPIGSDFATLMAASVLGQPRSQTHLRAAASLASVILEAGVPRTAEAFFVARNLLATVERPPRVGPMISVIDTANRRLDQAALWIAGNGLFVSCANVRAENASQMVTMPWRTTFRSDTLQAGVSLGSALGKGQRIDTMFIDEFLKSLKQETWSDRRG